ncbi:MAG TPA: thioredoxin [Chloroflexota bacterium]
MAEPMAVTDATFDAEVLETKEPVLVDFWAEWCGPCKMIAPILKELATEQDGKLKIAKLDVDGNMATARRFGVSSIPTLILFKEGKAVQRVVGYTPKDRLIKTLAPHIEVTA